MIIRNGNGIAGALRFVDHGPSEKGRRKDLGGVGLGGFEGADDVALLLDRRLDLRQARHVWYTAQRNPQSKPGVLERSYVGIL